MCFSVYAMERPTRGVDDDVWQRRPAVALGHSASRPFAARAVLALAARGENRKDTCPTAAMPDGLWAATPSPVRPRLCKQRCEFPAHEQRPDRDVQAPERSDGIPTCFAVTKPESLLGYRRGTPLEHHLRSLRFRVSAASFPSVQASPPARGSMKA
jgi:hypothetical protein